MIGLVISPTWLKSRWHALSPHINLLNSNEHPSFKKFVVTPDNLRNEDTRRALGECEAIIVDFNNSRHVGFYKNGPKFLLWVDEHCHTQKEVEHNENLFSLYDYVLCGSPWAPPKVPKYFYISEETKKKYVYFPHSVPDSAPEPLMWRRRLPRALLASNVCPHVYPFRWACGLEAKKGAPIDVLSHFIHTRETFLEHLGTYKYAITDNSYGWLNYTVAKYFEIPLMGCCLIATPNLEVDRKILGFEAGVNMVFTTSAKEAVRLIKSRSPDHERVGLAGRQLMLNHHTVSKRLVYLKELVGLARGGKVTLDDSANVFRSVTFGI